MYKIMKERVRCGFQYTDFINCARGVTQNDVCSPVLFSLIINDLALEFINAGEDMA